MQRLRWVSLRVREALWGFSDLIAPPSCAGCSASLWRTESDDEPAVFCSRCRTGLPWLLCRCAASTSTDCEQAARFCDACAGFAPEILRCRCAVSYEGEALRWIRRLKYPDRGLSGLDPTSLEVVGFLIRKAARKSSANRPDWIIPVPLHLSRLRQRGFNPAALLAHHAAKQYADSAVAYHLLDRHRATPSQTQLDRRSRVENVAGAFTCPYPRVVSGKRIVLVDDVVTTGATLRAAGRCLLNAGAQSVEALCAARALLPMESEETNPPLSSVGRGFPP